MKPLAKIVLAGLILIAVSANAFPQNGGDLSREIDAMPSPTTQPARSETRSTSTAIDWVGLIQLFAPSLIVAAAIGVGGSIAGTFVLLRRETLLALALPHVVAVGTAIGLRLGWPTLPPALIVTAGVLLYLTAEARGQTAKQASTSLGLLYIGGLCFSFLIIANGGQHVEELQALFTGIDVAVSPQQAATVAPILIVIGIVCACLWRRWLLLAQAPAAALAAGVKVAAWNGVFLTLLAIVVLLGTATQGVVMVLAMLLLPASVVLPWRLPIPRTLAAAVIVSWAMLGGGFVASNVYSLPMSQCVGVIGCVLVAASRSGHRLRY